MDEIHRRLATNIRELAQKRDLSLIRLADFSGSSRGYIFAVLRGASSPSMRWLAKIAEVLHVDPADLLKPARAKGEK